MAAPTTLLVDLDGTLVDIRARRALELSLVVAGAKRFARVIPPWRFHSTFFGAVRAARSHGSTHTNYEVLERTLSERSGAPRPTIAALLRGFIEEDFSRSARHWVPIPGARGLLEHARASGMRLVLATNPVWPVRAVRMRLAWAGLDDVDFDFVSHSEVMTRSKPHVAYYRELLTRIGRRPEECAMIGNDAVKDLPAVEIGIRTFLVRSPVANGRTGAPTRDARLDAWGSLDDAREWITAMRADANTTSGAPRLRALPSPAPIASERKHPMSTTTTAKTPKLICVTGPDGSGKTTQITKLAEHLEKSGQHKVAAVTIWDLLLDPSCKGKIVFDDPGQVDKYLSILHPTSRALFLYHCFHEALELARKRGADVILLNAYWYKYYATEVAHGGDRALLRQLAGLFPEPSLTFYLDVDPGEAFARKAMLSGYETGFASPRSREAFVAFQDTAHGVLDGLAKELGWVRLDGRTPMARLTEAMTDRIMREVA
jgi:FMN phosphatase YigB (HAD superfamily)/thymidylate kinase